MKKVVLLISIFVVYSCKNIQNVVDKNEKKQGVLLETNRDSVADKIEILNFGTFHMGETNDANKIEFDENNKKNQLAINEIATKLSLFRPTVIVVETPPEYDKKLQVEYNEYLSNPQIKFKNLSEIELLGYELGRISGVKRIYGIDHKMSYNYNVGAEMVNTVDSLWHNRYYKNPLKFYPLVNIDQKNLNLLEKLKITNNNLYLDFLIEVNAEMLSHVGSEKGFEGADEATKYYQRNLRMYSNLNRLNLTSKDRIFILMGASHTAYFRDFISRSPKYKMVNTFNYLK